MQIEIVYTFPPDADARQAAEKLAALDVLLDEMEILKAAAEAAETDEQRAEMEQAIQQGEAEQARRGELTAAATRREELRFTVRARAYLDRGHFSQLYLEGAEWFEAQTGHPMDAETMDAEAVELANFVYYRAGMLASIDRERTPDGHRYKAQTRQGEGEAWQPASIPGEWTTLEGMGGTMPLALFNAWNNATRELNPGAGDFFGPAPIRVSRRD